MKQAFIVTVLFCISLQIQAQELPAIQLDRPDQTECPFIVPRGYIQVENGFNVEHTLTSLTTYNYPSSLWKYGLNEHFEFRLITEVVDVRENGRNLLGLNPITVGFKTNICQEKGIIPITSFIGHLTSSNWGTKNLHATYWAPSFRFLMQHTLSKKVSLAYNLGMEWDGESAAPTYLYTLTTGISLSDKWGGYVELFGFAPQEDRANHSFDFGFTYLLNNNFMFDISSGFGLTDNAPINYISLGGSFRFNTRRHSRP